MEKKYGLPSQNKMKKNISIFAIILVGILGYMWGYHSVSPQIVEKERIVYDTIVHEKVKIDTLWRTRTEQVYLTEVQKDTLLVRDTVLVEVPIYTYVAKDSLYYVEAEGFGVNFKKIEVYPKTIYKEKTEFVESAKKWGFGVFAGYGASTHGLHPMVGVGVTYDIITW